MPKNVCILAGWEHVIRTGTAKNTHAPLVFTTHWPHLTMIYVRGSGIKNKSVGGKNGWFELEYMEAIET